MLRVGLGRITPINARATTPAQFSLGFADMGAGQVNITPDQPGITATFTRATAAWTKLSTGLWASVASGVPRSFYTGMDTAVGVYAGYLAEGARTNECLQSRAGTATHWIKTNTTATQNQTGIDGAANSCFSLAATGANGTMTQPIASTFTTTVARALSCFMRRLVGTGDVAVSLDGGANYTTVTPSINGTTFTRVETAGNPATATFAIKLVTSGDAVAVDMCQEEQGTFASTPVPATTATVTRNADVLTYPTTGWLNANTGTALVQAFDIATLDAVGTYFGVSDGSLNNRVSVARGTANATRIYRVVSGGVASVSTSGSVTPTGNASHKSAIAWAANDFAAYVDGAQDATDATVTVPSGLTTAFISTQEGASGAGQTFGPIRRVAYFGTRLSNAQVVQMTS